VTALPAILVAPTHRLAPEFRLPALAQDVAAAVAWVRRNIAAHGGDPLRLYLGGHSSGAHLAALVALCRDFLAAHDLPPDVLKGCFPISGTYDLDFPDPQPGSEAAAIQDTVLERREDAPRYSPLRYAEGNRTPVFLSYGSRDFGRAMDSGARLADALREQPGRFALDIREGLDHFDIALDACRADGPWLRTVHEWMTQTAAADWMPA
jgi:acetyl esterase/lipase